MTELARPSLVRRIANAIRAGGTRVSKAYARRRRHAPERALIAASGLFDVDYYREQTDAPSDALGHYLSVGARAGLNPHPLFDTEYYLRRNPDVASSLANPFAHFLRIGASEGRDPNPYFEVTYYLAQDPPLDPGENPILHYVREGARGGRRVGPSFDARYYVETYPEASSTRTPLEHFLRVGAPKGYLPHPSGAIPGTSLRRAPKPLAPTDSEWSTVRAHGADGAVVDVIVPVYRGYDDTLRAIHRVLTSRNRTPFELVVIDDHSPEPELVAALRALAERGLFTLLHNADNRGFVGTVNRGMALHPDRDVVLLNSDTEVFGDWLDRLRAAAASRDVGTVTPLSNNATVCSYPTFDRDNAMALELPFEALDELAASLPNEAIDLPTGVGFCMYVSRACLDATGLFDEARFGKGYGEENDFCRRALARGYRSVLAGNVFVRHTGSASFGAERSKRVEAAMETLRTLHPTYERDVASFVARDPARSLRASLDVARIRHAFGDARVFALLTHELGGGTETHVRALHALAVAEGARSLVLRPRRGAPGELVLETGIDAPFPNVEGLTLDDPQALAATLAALGVRHLHVHHLVGLGRDAATRLGELARSAEFTVDFTVHDYAAICPRVNLVDASGVYCGEPSIEACERCLARGGATIEATSVEAHRRAYGEMLVTMRRVSAPDDDVRLRLGRYFPNVDVRVLPHAEAGLETQPRIGRSPGEPLRVVVLGAVHPHKGLEVLIASAEEARRRRLPLAFTVIGYTTDDRRARAAGIEITGPYATAEEALARIAAARAHVALFPAVWPETYSYTLSIALAAELHVVAFDLGAIASRLRALGGGTLLPVGAMSDPAYVTRALAELAGGVLPPPLRDSPRSRRLSDYYDGIL